MLRQITQGNGGHLLHPNQRGKYVAYGRGGPGLIGRYDGLLMDRQKGIIPMRDLTESLLLSRLSRSIQQIFISPAGPSEAVMSVCQSVFPNELQHTSRVTLSNINGIIYIEKECLMGEGLSIVCIFEEYEEIEFRSSFQISK